MSLLHMMYKSNAVPLQAWSGPEGSRKLRFPYFMTTAQDGGKVMYKSTQVKIIHVRILIHSSFCVCVLSIWKPNFDEFATPYKRLISPV